MAKQYTAEEINDAILKLKAFQGNKMTLLRIEDMLRQFADMMEREKMNVPLLTNDDWKGFYSCVNFFTRHYESCVLTIRVDEGNIYVETVEAPKTIEGELVVDEHKKQRESKEVKA